MYIYVLFNILVYIHYICIFRVMSYFIDHIKKNEKHVKSSDSDQHVTQKLSTLKWLRNKYL